jgi:putative ABC transport system permease protein
VSGQIPLNDDECVMDARRFKPSSIGKSITISSGNTPEILGKFTNRKFKITGTVSSPQYINVDRGTTNMGAGLVAGFVFVKSSNFMNSPYTTVFLESDVQGDIYTEDRKVQVDAHTDELKQAVVQQISEKTNSTTNDSLMQQVRVLTREDNADYSLYKTDSSIVEDISRVFPVFFFLVAALVCMTTMVRMVNEERAQIGILKSLGYSTPSAIKELHNLLI